MSCAAGRGGGFGGGGAGFVVGRGGAVWRGVFLGVTASDFLFRTGRRAAPSLALARPFLSSTFASGPSAAGSGTRASRRRRRGSELHALFLMAGPPRLPLAGLAAVLALPTPGAEAQPSVLGGRVTVRALLHHRGLGRLRGCVCMSECVGSLCEWQAQCVLRSLGLGSDAGGGQCVVYEVRHLYCCRIESKRALPDLI